MRHSEAVGMVALVGKLWPSWRANESEDAAKATGKEWATEILPLDRRDVEEAIRTLGRLMPFAPALSEILDGAEECRRDRIPQLQPVGNYEPGRYISFKDWLATVATVEERAIVQRVGPSLFLKLEQEAVGIVPDKLEAARAAALAQLDAEANTAREGQAKPLRTTTPVETRSACGAAFGTPSVVRDGVAVCSRCGSPIADGCGGFAAERARGRA